MSELEECIITFLVEETRVNRTRVHLASRLSQDIDMDGDDAVEFFQKFGEKFHVNLTVLWARWDQHFFSGARGSPPGCMVVIVAAAFAGELVHRAVQWIPMWGAAVALFAAFCWGYFKFIYEPYDSRLPITVQDLVEAAASGEWVKDYETSLLFRALQ